jgi:protein TBF1
MTKRRRIDDGHGGGEVSGGEVTGYGGGPWDSDAQQHQQQPSSDQDPQASERYPPPFDNGGAASEYAGAGSAPAEHALTENPAPARWQSSSASPYPDVSSYQQPYFYQHTDPSIYTSPWPPAAVADSSSYGTASYNSMVQQSGTMPFFPSQTQTEQVQGFDDAGAGTGGFPSYPELDPAQPPYAYALTQSRTGAAKDNAVLFEDASMHFKIQSLSILDNLVCEVQFCAAWPFDLTSVAQATQLIQTIAKASFPQIQDMMRGNETEESQAYVTLKNLFDQTRKVYSRETPFIDAIAIQMFQPNQQEVIRKANIATFISSILGAHDVSFFHLNEFFMETFVPLGHRLLKWQGAIYLELKTQTYISALMNSDGSPEAMLDELFPADLDAQILTRHPDAPSLSPSEQDFIDRSRARKSYLLAEPSTEEALRELPKKYQWNDFVREFASCINKNVDGIMNVPLRAAAFGGIPVDKRGGGAQGLDALGGQQGLLTRRTQPANGAVNGAAVIPGLPALPQPSSTSSEKKTTSSNSTIRQPWTKPEEDALLAGLEKVNGPHWSQILALYGRGGSVSEVLKDRNQVQLKDKARNLKLWYLKMGKEVPVALRGVTGELRKRGGARARAALGLLDEDAESGANADAEGEDGGGENIDPSLEKQRSSKKKKKTKK